MRSAYKDFLLSAAIIGGFTPVASISLLAFGFPSLQVAFFAFVVPSMLLILLMMGMKEIRQVIGKGWIAGIAAVLVYDLSRLAFMDWGWSDFIPRIGQWLLEDPNAPDFVGYLWRYIGNGGGMGISFALIVHSGILKRACRWRGLCFGLAVFSCLMLTLFIAPNAQESMFRVTALTFTGSFIGHVVYGLVLGLILSQKLSAPVRNKA